jgi:hypothetical protein
MSKFCPYYGIEIPTKLGYCPYNKKPLEKGNEIVNEIEKIKDEPKKENFSIVGKK